MNTSLPHNRLLVASTNLRFPGNAWYSAQTVNPASSKNGRSRVIAQKLPWKPPCVVFMLLLPSLNILYKQPIEFFCSRHVHVEGHTQPLDTRSLLTE